MRTTLTHSQRELILENWVLCRQFTSLSACCHHFGITYKPALLYTSKVKAELDGILAKKHSTATNTTASTTGSTASTPASYLPLLQMQQMQTPPTPKLPPLPVLA